jgi:predicted lipoprotein with Yx(FWY)xxD motif
MNTKHGFLIVAALATMSLAGCASGGSSGGDTSGGGDGGSPAATSPATPGTTSGSADLATASTPLGTVVVDAAGMTVYFFDKDTPNSGTSACTGACLANWPPVTASSSTPTADGVTGTLGTITTPNGMMQVTLQGLPLYTYAGDKAPGDVTGQAVNNIWWVVNPSGEKVTKAVSTGTGY